MKSVFLTVAIILSSLYLSSCNDDFSPFGEYTERYALFSILRNDSTFQVAMLGKSYGAGLLDASGNTEDHSITGAEIKIWRGDSVYFFRDSVINNPGQDTLLRYYYNETFAISYNEILEIEALLSNGKRLKASTVTPKEFSYKPGEVLVPPDSTDNVLISWNRNEEGIFFQPRLYFRYLVEGDSVIKIKEIPTHYVQQEGVYVPVFPESSASISVFYEMDAITRSLNEISVNEQDRGKFSVFEKLVFEAAVLDANLSRYISSTSKSFDDLTARVDELDYTNISGGFGIFGSFISKPYSPLFFQPDYIFSFGYRFNYE